jgi:hypothetical protein
MPELAPDAAALGYDPLLDIDAKDEEYDESGGQMGPNTSYQAKSYYIKRDDNRTASQRIEDLFTSLAPRKRVLQGILRFLDEPKRSDALDEKVEELQKHDASVYTGYEYSALLEEAGAIVKVAEDGSKFDAEAEQEPDIVEVGGAKFYKPTDGKLVFWLITEDGKEYLERDDPYGNLKQLLAAEPQYQAIYKTLLEYCGNDEGRSGNDLSELIDNDPLVQSPRRYFSYFAKKLEDCNAIVWRGQWHTSEHGKKALEELLGD